VRHKLIWSPCFQSSSYSMAVRCMPHHSAASPMSVGPSSSPRRHKHRSHVTLTTTSNRHIVRASDLAMTSAASASGSQAALHCKPLKVYLHNPTDGEVSYGTTHENRVDPIFAVQHHITCRMAHNSLHFYQTVNSLTLKSIIALTQI
jgi:hypothetical protein